MYTYYTLDKPIHNQDMISLQECDRVQSCFEMQCFHSLSPNPRLMSYFRLRWRYIVKTGMAHAHMSQNAKSCILF